MFAQAALHVLYDVLRVFYDIAEQQTVKYKKLCSLGSLHRAIPACSGNKSCQPEK